VNDVVISAERVGKKYRLGASGQPYHTLRESVSVLAWAPFLARRGVSAPSRRPEFWALKDLNLEVREGEVLGVIGRNGAGKSTLLRLLGEISEPTEGRIRIRGRVASLLEVGTGFHPELSGRENVFLNGAILGMQKYEIIRKFEEIVSFAEVEEFIDTPVKRYSSGMYLRLAFAVAAHLRPEILLVDEVLAVGDIQFQKRCVDKMVDVTRDGRTVLFVSHNMAAVNRLCRRAVWLDQGRVRSSGSVADVVESYLNQTAVHEGERLWPDHDSNPGNSKAVLRAVRVLSHLGRPVATADVRQPVTVEIEYEVRESLPDLRVSIQLLTSDGTIVFHSADTSDREWYGRARQPGRYSSRCDIPGYFLNSVQYSVTVAADIPHVEVLFQESSVITFGVEQTGGPSSHYGEIWPGAVCPALHWSVQCHE
jgi:lipopolysaccharide transport system ATP-binding protein